MKKFLLATSILAASAGFAAAEVKVSGSARMGIIYNGTDALFSSRVRVSFGMSGTTDGGLEFGASVRADQSGGNGGTVTDSGGNTHANGTTGTTNGDSTVYIKGAFGKLTMGDTGNVADSLVGQVSGVGYGPGALDGAADVAFLDTIVKTGVSYEYSTGAVTFALGTGQTTAANDYMSVAAKYSTDAYSVALGYETDSAADVLSLSGSATFGAATVKAKIADNSAKPDLGYALSVDYTTGAATITAFYADDNAVDANIGLGVAYDLGGGAAVKAGIGSVGGTTVADVGVTMSF